MHSDSTRLSPHVMRIVANNPSPYTAAGSNSYLIFGPLDGAVLVDAGPDLPQHAAAIQSALQDVPLRAILLTHGHADHAGGAARLGKAHRAPIYGFAPDSAAPDTMGEAMAPLTPDHLLQDGAQIAVAGLMLKVVHTPGHTGDHACFALGDYLFTGDHVMGWASSLVAPPQGNMAQYRASLRKLQAQEYLQFLPGHGPVIDDPQARLAELVAHRNQREAEVTAALSLGPASAAGLAQRIYTQTPALLLPGAALNTLAHLIELRDCGRAIGPAKPDVHSVFTITDQRQGLA